MNFLYLGYDVLSAKENMQKDNDCLIDANKTSVILRFYTWKEKCVTFGYNQNEEKVKAIVANSFDSDMFELAKRPTGGGIVIHQPGNLSWSIIFPVEIISGFSLLKFYYSLSMLYADVLSKCGVACSLKKMELKEYKEKKINDICYDYPAKYELVDKNGGKVIGSAQRKNKQFLIQQNNLFIEEPDNFKNELLKQVKTFTM